MRLLPLVLTLAGLAAPAAASDGESAHAWAPRDPFGGATARSTSSA